MGRNFGGWAKISPKLLPAKFDFFLKSAKFNIFLDPAKLIPAKFDYFLDPPIFFFFFSLKTLNRQDLSTAPIFY